MMEEMCGPQEKKTLLKNKPYLVTFDKSILVSLWIFTFNQNIQKDFQSNILIKKNKLYKKMPHLLYFYFYN